MRTKVNRGLKNVACKTLWPVLKKNSLYNNSSLYIINHDGHRICPSSVQLSEGSTLGPPLPVKTCRSCSFFRLIVSTFCFQKGGETVEPVQFIYYIKTTNSLLKKPLTWIPGDINVLKYKQCTLQH
jgi:hypothetical protein